MTTGRLADAVARIDAANADDPHTLVVDGVERPKEQAHAELMTAWVTTLDPGASDEQLIAARAHHLRRWSLPRSSYPEGRAGYLRWRKALKDQHAEEVAALVSAAGYDEASIARVQAIIRKDGLTRAAPGDGVQVHEDALCLVFLQTQALELAGELGGDKTVDVLRKTIAKMSPAGISAALALELEADVRALLERAVAPDEVGSDPTSRPEPG
ncbi:MAG: DUF4202 domain-containing protein [Acidimicrobiales bacterium]